MGKILAAISGGVDSAVATALLVKDGHEVLGAYMKNWINEDNIAGNCPWQQDIEDARAVCDQLGIEFRVVNLMQAYRERVVKYLLEGYQNGITPNPDVMCNREMKFGVFRDYARDEGCCAVATGHYAQRRSHADGSVDILRGADSNKDQTYFLAMLDQSQAADARFPIGHLPKPEVRQIAEKMGLVNARKKDSQGICFIGEVKMSDFLSAYVDDDPGAIVTVDGQELGQHRGLHLYTLGQRRGLGVASNQFGRAYVVVAKRPETKELVIGFDESETPGLYAQSCEISSVSFVNGDFTGSKQIQAQARYRTQAEFISIESWDEEDRAMKIKFVEPQRALTPGQICAFYEEDRLVGGGIFSRIG